MEPAGRTQEDRADLLGAKRDHRPDACRIDRLHRLRAVGREVDPEFAHDLDGVGVDLRRRAPRALHRDAIAEDPPAEAFGHLAARGVRDAEEENALALVAHASLRLVEEEDDGEARMSRVGRRRSRSPSPRTGATR